MPEKTGFLVRIASLLGGNRKNCTRLSSRFTVFLRLTGQKNRPHSGHGGSSNVEKTTDMGTDGIGEV